MTTPFLIGVDWGSSSVRVLLIAADATIVGVRRADDGVFTGQGPFDARLRRHLGDWLTGYPALPILMCGMIGSDRGWKPAAYAKAPAGLAELAQALTPVPFDRDTRIVPGVSLLAGDTAEVMRGEETLLMGLLAQTNLERARVSLPGTHSKWAEIENGRIVNFRTYMTGELRALVLAQGALASGVPQIASDDAFAQGLAAAQAGATHALFQARARRLLGVLQPEHTASFVSGVLIGVELFAETGGIVTRETPLILAARGAVATEYCRALDAAHAAYDVIDPELLSALGLLRIAQAAGLA